MHIFLREKREKRKNECIFKNTAFILIYFQAMKIHTAWRKKVTQNVVPLFFDDCDNAFSWIDFYSPPPPNLYTLDPYFWHSYRKSIYSQTWANDHLRIATTILWFHLDFYYINDLWSTTTCQQRPLLLGPEGGRNTNKLKDVVENFLLLTNAGHKNIIEIYTKLHF